ncbi:hypothetical protein [Metasolibacillus sp.]|uniref:hypothetical protein n=1 Tax=Metasolibacillus sp. TaxID=2703680 RepID=UPI0025CD939D|nr:hypothetical protein [Metasolibacillus sp.]MCT6923622.1 hypothetical protein [Metasolibacillus sp.]MCT6939655.1 hypothetical protein [Metasolibacillus sp.]
MKSILTKTRKYFLVPTFGLILVFALFNQQAFADSETDETIEFNNDMNQISSINQNLNNDSSEEDILSENNKNEEDIITLFNVEIGGDGGGTTYYPNKTIPMNVGDLLISTNYSLDTALVGHVGIVGPDLYVYEVTKFGLGARTSITSYIGKHNTANLGVYRVNGASIFERYNAGKFAKNNYMNVKSYAALDGNPYNITTSYCSEFVWHAYYKANYTIPGLTSLSLWTEAYGITPRQLADNTSYIGSLK